MPDTNSVPGESRGAAQVQAGAQGASNAGSAQVSRQGSTTVSRRTSQIYPMSPPPLPIASPQSPSLTGSVPSFDAAGVPMRHPRPLTAAELHLELEKEQEAVVNRLTRELSALRAHSASVASTASSVTSGMHEDMMLGATHPTGARRHRSSSSVSRSGIVVIPPHPPTTSIPHRYSISSQNAGTENAAHQARSASVVSTPRYEEVAHYRQELEEAKRENEGLKRRIRELERALKGEAEGERGRTRGPGE